MTGVQTCAVPICLSKEIVISNSTVTKVIDDLTYANGPGVHFVLIGFANEKQPTVMSTVDPEGLNKLLNWLLQRKEACTVDLLDMDADSFKKGHRSEEHTSELQSLMRISYAVFCLKKKKTNK